LNATAGHVFVSHSSDNRELANELAAFIEARGARIWIAPRDVRPGMDYSEQLQLAIESCVAFVVLVTDMANKSPYVRAETEMAFSTNKPIFPVRITDIQPAAGLALFLKIRHWTDAYGKGRDAAMDRLVLELRTVSGVPDDKTRIAANAATGQADATSVAEIDISLLTGSSKDLATIGNYLQVVDDALTDLTDASSTMGSVSSRIATQQTFVKALIDSNTSAIGTLVDANMEEESTKLKALQTQQQLAIQSLSIANSSSQNILSLFRN